MPLEIIKGRSKSGKSRYIYDEISRLASIGEEVLLIVPEQFTHSAERHILEVVEAIRDDKVEVFSFRHLADVTQTRLNLPEIPRINPVGKAIIIRKILQSCELSFYKDAGSQDGFIDLVAGSISEFKKYMISPEALKIIAKETDDEVLAMKLADLSDIYFEYEKQIQEEYCDGDDMLTALSGLLNQYDIYNNKHVFFDGFSIHCSCHSAEFVHSVA
jgi:ATP-dependent helicase/nuclease subunit B